MVWFGLGWNTPDGPRPFHRRAGFRSVQQRELRESARLAVVGIRTLQSVLIGEGRGDETFMRPRVGVHAGSVCKWLGAGHDLS